MHTPYETEWMAKERMKEAEQWIKQQTLLRQNSSKKKCVSFFIRILNLLHRK